MTCWKSFSLRTVFVVICAIAVVLTLVRNSYFGRRTLIVRPDCSECEIFLDNVFIGTGEAILDVERATVLGLPEFKCQRVQYVPFGAFLIDYRRPDGRVPLLHLKPPRDGADGYRTAKLSSGHAIVVKSAWYSIPDGEIRIITDEPLTRSSLDGCLSVIGKEDSDEAVVYEIRVDLPIAALDEGIDDKIILHAVSEMDGRMECEVNRSLHLLPDGKGTLLLKCVKRHRDEGFVIVFFLVNNKGYITKYQASLKPTNFVANPAK